MNPQGKSTDGVAGKRPVDLAADLLVYAPLGLATTLRDLLPVLVERGRTEMGSQVTVAKTVGKLLAQQGQEELERKMTAARQQAGALAGQLLRQVVTRASTPSPTTSRPPASAPPAAPKQDRPPVAPSPAPPSGGRQPAGRPSPARQATTTPQARPRRVGGAPTAAAASAAIADYDSLAASQVIARLAGLSPSELDAVGRYEAATRGRRTILARVAQLQR